MELESSKRKGDLKAKKFKEGSRGSEVACVVLFKLRGFGGLTILSKDKGVGGKASGGICIDVDMR